MCGIAGIATADAAAVPAPEALQRMIAALHHRGPDGQGFHRAPGIGLAHARLAIIDLVSGQQPLHNEDRSVWVVFNGEIFNYIELRAELLAAGHRFATASDTEVLVHAYEQYGLDFVTHLNGQFAIALWDERARRLVLARDRVGIRPLVYAETPQGLAFASEAKSLFAAGWLAPRLDPVGIAEVATFWGCVAPRTAFSGVAALPPGHLAVWEHGRLSTRKYWDWDFGAVAPLQPERLEAATEELRELFIDSVRLQLRADVPVGAYLSGGLDSSAIVAAVRRHLPNRLRTFSLTFADAEFDEREYQQQVVAALQTEHSAQSVSQQGIGAALPRAIRHIEAPIVRTAGVPLMLLADQVRASQFKVVLSGEGADEVFGGYDLFKEAKIRRFWARQPDSAWRPLLLKRLYAYLGHSPTGGGALGSSFFRRGLTEVGDPFYAHRTRFDATQRGLQLLAPDFRAAIERDHPINAIAGLAPLPQAGWPPLCRDQYVEAHTLLTSYLLQAQGDRVAMAASIEGRYPFLDHRLIEFANRLPPAWKIRGLREKYLLRRAVAPWLPERVAQRTKQPYRTPDVASFFSGGQPLDYVAELLSEACLKSAGYFDPVRVKWLFEKCRAGKAIGFADNMAFMTVLSTQLLHRQFVEAR